MRFSTLAALGAAAAIAISMIVSGIAGESVASKRTDSTKAMQSAGPALQSNHEHDGAFDQAEPIDPGL